MALLLRLAAALDRRPDPVVETLEVEITDSSIILELVPERLNQNLSLEQWSLESCEDIVREVTGLSLKVRVQE